MNPQYVTRPIRPDDRHDILRSLKDGRVSPQSMYQRFHGSKPTLTAAELDYLTVVDQISHVAIVATPVRRPDHIVGVARVIRDQDNPAVGEMAILVSDLHQGRGVAGLLIADLTQRAENVGIGAITGLVQRANTDALGLLQRFGGKIVGQDDGCREVRMWSETALELASCQ